MTADRWKPARSAAGRYYGSREADETAASKTKPPNRCGLGVAGSAGHFRERQSRGAVNSGPPGGGELRGSDFLQEASGKNAAQAWAVMDELTDTLRAVDKRVYGGMRKLQDMTLLTRY